jgi:DNA polymerase-1
MADTVGRLERTYPGIRSFMKQIENVGRTREAGEGQGYVVTPYGRRLPCDEDKYYTLVNYLLQGHAAEIFKQSLVDLDHSGWGEFMILPVHDEILMDVPDELVAEALVEVPRAMGNTRDYAVPITAESEGGFTRWSEKYD